MNILHLKYAVEVEKTRSINKAAENLYMGQPNLSRAIKELEESLGITIFKRTSKGISLTPQGEEFMMYARKIIAQVDAVEMMYKGSSNKKQSFSVSVPRAAYIAEAFTEFSKSISTSEPAELFYKETNSMRAINNMLQEDYKLGIIRYQKPFESYFKTLFHEKGFSSEVIREFSYVTLMSSENPLAKEDDIKLKELANYIEIAHADPYVPSLPLIDTKKAELSEYVDKRIYVFERASQMELLSRLPNTFMWVSPTPEKMLDRYGLVERKCSENKKVYKDVLIYHKGYRFSELDERFIAEVRKFV